MRRRDLLKSGGALIVGFHFRQGFGGFDLAHAQGRRTANEVDGWIAVGNDGVVTAYTGKCELGQGMQTAQMQLVAEELSVPIARVRLVMCDTAITPDQGTTSGSQSHPANFNHANLALAAATARDALIDLAAARLRVPPAELTTADGFVAMRADGARRIAYADLIGGRTFEVPLNPAAKRKAHANWTVLGRSVPIVDFASMVTGRTAFVHNVRVPGMLHGRVVRPPSVNATLVSVDERSIAGMPGVVRVVRRKDFLGVVAEKPWQAMQAAAKLSATWKDGAPLPAHAGFYDHLRPSTPSGVLTTPRNMFVINSGDVDQTLLAAKRVIKATYLHPYQMHGAMGTSCAVADVQKDRATVWSSTQAAYGLRNTLAILLDLPIGSVRVVFTRGSGCYGINGADTVSYDAALLSQAVGRPVRVQLSRQDEMAWENYGFPYVIEQTAALADDGSIAAWDHESWNASLGGRPGYDRPGNVITGRLAGFAPVAVAPGSNSSGVNLQLNNGSNAAPSYVSAGTGTIASQRVFTHTSASPFPTGPLRSPSRLQNTFAHESFIDEIAAHVKADPVAYRLRHLRDPRLREVLTAAAKAAQWETRPSPRAGRPRTGIARGRGIACVLYEGDNGYCALVAEVDVEQSTGQVIAKRLVTAQDCGPISNPDGMKNQIEGGALQGLSRALGEEVTWDAQKVTSVDWRSYRSLTLGFEPPIIESVLINRPDSEAMGAGETTITIVAAAVANAIFDATGVRIREVPFTADRVLAALARRN
jgi:CO/xanthine dehydrogenase Mo-binding subunit